MSFGTNTVYFYLNNIEGGSTVSTSLLHHAFGIAGIHCTSAEYESGQVVFHIKPGDRLPHLFVQSVSGWQWVLAAKRVPRAQAANAACTHVRDVFFI